MNGSFIFYRSFAEAVEELPPAQFKEIMTAITAYALDGIFPESLDPMLKGYFILMRPQIDANNNRRENGRKGGNIRQSEADQSTTEANGSKPEANGSKAQANDNDNVNDNVNVNVNANRVRKAAGRFTPPTVAEVAEFCRERCNGVNPERFHSFYAARGWKMGERRIQMEDWKAAVISWEKGALNLPDRKGAERSQDLDAMLIKHIISKSHDRATA